MRLVRTPDGEVLLRRKVRSRARPESVARTAKHYLNTTLSLFLAFIVSIGSTPVRGTYAYFTNTQQNTGNAFTTDTLAAPTSVTAQPAGSSITVAWTPPTATYVNGYDIYSSSDSFTTAVGSVSAGVNAFTHSPTTATDYSYKIKSKAGTSGAWTSAFSGQSPTVTFSPITPKVIPPVSPADLSEAVGTNAAVLVVFSEQMDTTTAAAGFKLRPCTDNLLACSTPDAANPVAGTVTWPGTNNSRLLFTPTSPLSAGQVYQVFVDGTGGETTAGGPATDFASGAAVAADFTSVFKTGSTTDVSPPGAPTVSSPSADTQVIEASFALTGSLSTNAYNAAVAATSPAGYWRLSETAGTVAADSAGSNPGTYSAAVVAATHSIAGALAGDTNTAINIDGAVLSNITIPSHTAYNTSSFSVEFWVKPAAVGTQQGLVCKGSGCDPASWRLYLTASGGLTFDALGGTPSLTATSPVLSTSSWNHVVATYDSGSTTARIYVNGSQAAVNTSMSDVGNTQGLPIEVAPNITNRLTGGIDELAFYSSALSAATVQEHYRAQCGSDANALIKVYRDDTPTNTGDASYTLLSQYNQQLNGGLTSFSIPVELGDGPNRFALTATDAQGRESSKTPTYLITRTTTALKPGLVSLSPAATSIAVTAPFTGDYDSDGTATVRWRNPPSSGSYNAPVSMTRGTNQFAYSITGLVVSTTYEVEVTYADGDGLASGGGSSTQTASTTTSGALDITTVSQTPSGGPFASRAGQSLGISITTNAGSSNYIQVVVNTSSPKTIRTCTALTPGSFNLTWDGTDGVSSPVEDGTYTYTVTTWPTSSCNTTAVETVTRQATISNAANVALEPAPASVTLSAGQYACVTATVRNRAGGLVPDGVPVQFSFSLSAGSGTYNLTGASSGTDQTAQNTTVTSNTGAAVTTGTPAGNCTAPPSGSGQAVAKIGVLSASTQTITVRAQVSTQLSGITGSTVSNYTTVNDPPNAPTNLVLTPGSVKVAFQPSSSGVATGYLVHLGVAPGVYDRKIDIGNKTSVTIEDVIPGQRYWVTVQAYDKLGQLSAMSSEASLVAPPNAAAASVTLDATSRTPGAPLRLGAIVRAKVIDASGRGVGGAPITLTSGTGTRLESASMITDVNGEVATGLTVDDQTLARTVIGATSGAATGSLELTLLPPTATPTATVGLTATVTGTVVIGTTTPVGTPTTATADVTPTALPGTVTVAPTIGTALVEPVGSPTGTVTGGVVGTPTPTPLANATATPGASVSPVASAPAAASSSAPAASPPAVTATPAPPSGSAVATNQPTSAAGASAASGTGAGGAPSATSAGGTSASPVATSAPPAPTSPPPTSAPATSVPPTTAPAVPPTSAPAGPPTSALAAPPPTLAPSSTSSQPTTAPSTGGAPSSAASGGTAATPIG